VERWEIKNRREERGLIIIKGTKQRRMRTNVNKS
jgi:hypothetical protein